MLQDPLWIDEQKALHRVRAFKILCDEHQAKRVSHCYSVRKGCAVLTTYQAQHSSHTPGMANDNSVHLAAAVSTLDERLSAPQTTAAPEPVSLKSRMSLAHLLNNEANDLTARGLEGGGPVPAVLNKTVTPKETTTVCDDSEANDRVPCRTGFDVSEDLLVTAMDCDERSTSCPDVHMEDVPSSLQIPFPWPHKSSPPPPSSPLQRSLSTPPPASSPSWGSPHEVAAAVGRKRSRPMSPTESMPRKQDTKGKGRARSPDSDSERSSDEAEHELTDEEKTKKARGAGPGRESQPRKCDTRKRDAPPRGDSKSNRHTTTMNKAIRNGEPIEFKHYQKRRATFEESIRKFNTDVDFPDPKCKYVRHIVCGRDVQMKAPFNTAAWEDHFKPAHRNPLGCKGYRATHAPMKGAGTRLLQFRSITAPQHASQAAVTVSSSQLSSSLSAASTRVCPGLSGHAYSQVDQYLRRSPAFGGGGSSLSKLAKANFGQEYVDLTDKLKKEVRLKNKNGWQWQIDDDMGAVFASDCLQSVDVQPGADPTPCTQCRALLSLKAFKKACSLAVPEDKHIKNIPAHYFNAVSRLLKLYAERVGLRSVLENEVGILGQKPGFAAWLGLAQA